MRRSDLHGGSLTRDAIPRYTRALHEQRFAYDSRHLGRDVVTPESVIPGTGAPPADVTENDPGAQPHR